VRSRIIKGNGEPLEVDYMMRRNGDSWLISDVYWDGVCWACGFEATLLCCGQISPSAMVK
jgi:ABC-type transporter MlaC component